MLAWLTLLMGVSISLLFGATTATSAQFLSPEAQANRTAHGLVRMHYVLERGALLTLY